MTTLLAEVTNDTLAVLTILVLVGLGACLHIMDNKLNSILHELRKKGDEE